MTVIEAMTTLPRSCLPSLACLLASLLPCQQLPEGYVADLRALPAGTGTALQTPSGLVAFDGTRLLLHAPGLAPQVLLQLPSFAFGSFAIQAGPDRVLFGESSNGALWLVPLDPAPPAQPLAQLPLNYDAVLYAPNLALVSAKTGGFATPDNDVVLVDLTTGQTRTVARFPGASGPLATSANGDVYYATASLAFPTPPGATDVLRLTRAQIDLAAQQQTVLGPADAQIVVSGLDAAGDLAFDDDDDLFFVDYVNGAVGELHDVSAAALAGGAPLLDYATAGVSPVALQFVPAATPGLEVFEPFQPPGGALFVFETDFGATAAMRRVRATRASLAVNAPAPVPTGPFGLVATAGPANGLGVVALAVGVPAGIAAVALPGFEQPLLLDGVLFAGPALATVVFDPAGHATLPLGNPGFQPALDVTAQAVVFALGGAVGTTAATPFRVGM